MFCDLADVAALWTEFERNADHTAFQSFGRLRAWQRHVGRLTETLPVVVVGHLPGVDPLFILPLAVEPQGHLKRLTWLGSDLADYNAPLLHPACRDHCPDATFAIVWRDVLAAIREQASLSFDLVDLPKMPEHVGAQPNPFLALSTSPNPSGAYAAGLGSDWESFYAERRSSSTRKKDRQQLRRLSDFGQVRFVPEITEDEEREATLRTLFAQKERSFTRMGVPSLFDRPGYRAFFTELVLDPAHRAHAHLSRLEIGGSIASVSVGLRTRDTYSLVLASYDDGEIAKFGPGRAHLHELLRYAIEHGFTTFDFTIGDEPYKLDWSEGPAQLHDHLTPATWRGVAAGLWLAQTRKAKRTIKQNPHLWAAFTAARRWTGALARRA